MSEPITYSVGFTKISSEPATYAADLSMTGWRIVKETWVKPGFSGKTDTGWVVYNAQGQKVAGAFARLMDGKRYISDQADIKARRDQQALEAEQMAADAHAEWVRDNTPAEVTDDAEAPAEQDDAKLDKWQVQPNRADMRRALHSLPRQRRQVPPLTKVRERGSQDGKQGQPLIMGLHYRGRAMGAKHYALIAQAQAEQAEQAAIKAGA